MRNPFVPCVLILFLIMVIANAAFGDTEQAPFIHAAKPDWQSSVIFKRITCLKIAVNDYNFLRYHGKTDRQATVIVQRSYYKCLTKHGVAI